METHESTRPNVGRMEAQFKALGARLDKLVDHVEGVGAQVKTDYRERIDDLKAKREAVRVKLDEIRTAKGEKWEGLKAGFYRAWNDLEAAFKRFSHPTEGKQPGPRSTEPTDRSHTPPAH